MTWHQGRLLTSWASAATKIKLVPCLSFYFKIIVNNKLNILKERLIKSIKRTLVYVT